MMQKDFPPIGRVVFCDSGLGTLDVAANFIAELRTGCRFRELEIICFNAWPRPGVGFNQLPDLKTKLQALHQVNEAIAKMNPDLVVYGCNTISTLLADGAVKLPFPAQTMLHPVTQLLAEALQKKPDANLLICGTTTTAQSRFYSRQLTANGSTRAHIAELGCPGLATQIEYAPHGAVVRQMIRNYARQAAAQFPRGELLLALCCTHFGYADAWQEEFSRYFVRVTLLNPNRRVVDEILPDWQGKIEPHIAVKLLSRIEISREKRAAIAPLIEMRAPELSRALQTPLRDKDLFTF